MGSDDGVTVRIFTEPQQGASYDQQLAMARVAEEGGFDAYFRSDHILKMGSADGLPGYTDAWTTLAGLARDTSRIRLGTLVTPVTFRHPGMFAVQATQVDQMSGGRVDVGLGAGWYGAEHEAYGLPFPEMKSRFDVLEDQVAILHGLWRTPAGGTFAHQGITCSVSLEADTLRPAGTPPPIVLGGRGGPRAARLAAAHADEYNIPFVPPSIMKAVHDQVRAACEKAGRDPGELSWSVGQVVCCGRDAAEVERRAKAMGREVDELRTNGLTGSPAEVVEKAATFTAAGADRLYLQVMDITDLDHVRLLAEEVLPHL